MWGVGIGCFGAAFNNFLVETYDINGFDCGVLEFLRETPSVLLVAIFAALQGTLRRRNHQPSSCGIWVNGGATCRLCSQVFLERIERYAKCPASLCKILSVTIKYGLHVNPDGGIQVFRQG